MTRKAARKAKAGRGKAAPSKATRSKAAPKKHATPASPKAQDKTDIAAYVATATQALGLAVDPSWQANIVFNLNLILRHAALVDGFPLPDDAEPAPVFHA